MMNKTLTTAAVRTYKPARDRREIPDGGCSHLYLVIEPTGRKSWALRARRPDGRPGKLRLGTVDVADGHVANPEVGKHLTLKSARMLATQLLNELASGVDVFEEHKEERRRMAAKFDAASSATFPAMARDFVERHLRDRKGSRTWWRVALVLGLDYEFRPGPAKAEPTVIKSSLCDRWASRAVADITKVDVRGVVDEARSTGIPGRAVKNKKPSGAREREMSGALGGLFNWLLRHRGAVDVDPTAALPGAQPSAERDRVLTDDELRAVWSACDMVNPAFAGVIKVMALTGQRRGEVEGMRWDELSDDCRTWTIPGSRTKNKQTHVVSLSSAVRELIGNRDSEKPGFVFTTDGRTHVSGFGKVKDRIDTVVKFKAPWRFHDLRRTAVTGMAEIGIQPHIIEAVINHKSGHKGGIAGIYNKAEYAEPKRKALERWAMHVAAVVTGTKDDTVVPLRA
jgi:integrase